MSALFGYIVIATPTSDVSVIPEIRLSIVSRYLSPFADNVALTEKTFELDGLSESHKNNHLGAMLPR
jgi:hypothetical protein